MGAGAVRDLMGLRLGELDPGRVSDLLLRHPRDGSTRWLTGYAMMPALVRIAPLP